LLDSRLNAASLIKVSTSEAELMEI